MATSKKGEVRKELRQLRNQWKHAPHSDKEGLTVQRKDLREQLFAVKKTENLRKKRKRQRLRQAAARRALWEGERNTSPEESDPGGERIERNINPEESDSDREYTERNILSPEGDREKRNIEEINISPNSLVVQENIDMPREPSESRLMPIGVFWDIENCQVPRGGSVSSLAQKIRDTFFSGHTEVEFLCVCDATKQSKHITEQLNFAQVTVVHVNSTCKNAADDKLRHHLRRFGNLHTAPATVILISGDINFASELSDLRHVHNFYVILLHPPHVIEALLKCTNEHHNFVEFVADLPRDEKSKQPAKEAEQTEVLVRNLPESKPIRRVKSCLLRLSENLGGKVLNVSGTSALLRFPNEDAANRATVRLRGEKVLGKKIKAELQQLSKKEFYGKVKSERKNSSSLKDADKDIDACNLVIDSDCSSSCSVTSSRDNSQSPVVFTLGRDSEANPGSPQSPRVFRNKRYRENDSAERVVNSISNSQSPSNCSPKVSVRDKFKHDVPASLRSTSQSPRVYKPSPRRHDSSVSRSDSLGSTSDCQSPKRAAVNSPRCQSPRVFVNSNRSASRSPRVFVRTQRHVNSKVASGQSHSPSSISNKVNRSASDQNPVVNDDIDSETEIDYSFIFGTKVVQKPASEFRNLSPTVSIISNDSATSSPCKVTRNSANKKDDSFIQAENKGKDNVKLSKSVVVKPKTVTFTPIEPAKVPSTQGSSKVSSLDANASKPSKANRRFRASKSKRGINSKPLESDTKCKYNINTSGLSENKVKCSLTNDVPKKENAKALDDSSKSSKLVLSPTSAFHKPLLRSKSQPPAQDRLSKRDIPRDGITHNDSPQKTFVKLEKHSPAHNKFSPKYGFKNSPQFRAKSASPRVGYPSPGNRRMFSPYRQYSYPSNIPYMYCQEFSNQGYAGYEGYEHGYGGYNRGYDYNQYGGGYNDYYGECYNNADYNYGYHGDQVEQLRDAVQNYHLYDQAGKLHQQFAEGDSMVSYHQYEAYNAHANDNTYSQRPNKYSPFRRTPGARRPNNSGGSSDMTSSCSGSRPNSRNEPQQCIFNYTASSSTTNSSAGDVAPQGGDTYPPVRPTSPLLSAADLGNGNFAPDESNPDACELVVSNLDYNISAREWKKILFTEFSQQVQVLGVHVQTQADNTNVGFVKVASVDEARYAISQFHRKKIGYKRIHVVLMSTGRESAPENIGTGVVTILRESPDGKLPLFKLLELFEKRYHQIISVNDLSSINDLAEIVDQEGSGKVVCLLPKGQSSQVAGGHLAQQGVSDQEEALCKLHYSFDIEIDIHNFILPRVSLHVKTFTPQVHALLMSHSGDIPLISFPSCFKAEFSSEVKVNETSGIYLEHFITCVPGVKIVGTVGGVKKIQWAEHKPPPPSADLSRVCGSPVMSAHLSQFSRDTIDLLRTQSHCSIPLNNFIPAYHHRYNRPCRVVDYGYNQLTELFEAIPHIVQLLGSGSEKIVTLAHRAQVKHFTNDILRILKSQASRQINIMDLPIVYNKVMGGPFNITMYGVCYIEDLLEELSENTVVVYGVGAKMVLSIPKKIQSAAEAERVKQFSLEVIDLLKYSPQCRMPFNKFIPAYHHHFGKQCRVSDYGFSKLLELLESIPQTLRIEEDNEEKTLCLSEEEMLHALQEQIVMLLRCYPGNVIPIPEFLSAYVKYIGWELKLSDYGVCSVSDLLKKVPHVAKEEKRDGKYIITLVDHSETEVLCQRLLLLLMEKVDGMMPMTQLDDKYFKVYGYRLNLPELATELQDIVQVSYINDKGMVKLTTLQLFARDVVTVLRAHQGKLNLHSFEAAYAAQFGVSLVPATYGYASLLSLLQAIPFVIIIDGKGCRRVIMLAEQFVVKEKSELEVSEVNTKDMSTPISDDSGITEGREEDDRDLMSITSRSRSPQEVRTGSPLDLLSAKVPSQVPSPELTPAVRAQSPPDLINFEQSKDNLEEILSSLTIMEKKGQKTPLCRTPVSDMLQFAAQLLPNRDVENHMKTGEPSLHSALPQVPIFTSSGHLVDMTQGVLESHFLELHQQHLLASGDIGSYSSPVTHGLTNASGIGIQLAEACLITPESDTLCYTPQQITQSTPKSKPTSLKVFQQQQQSGDCVSIDSGSPVVDSDTPRAGSDKGSDPGTPGSKAGSSPSRRVRIAAKFNTPISPASSAGSKEN